MTPKGKAISFTSIYETYLPKSLDKDLSKELCKKFAIIKLNEIIDILDSLKNTEKKLNYYCRVKIEVEKL